jgi:hypothetical protein
MTTTKTIEAKAGQTWLMRNGQKMTIEKIDSSNGDFPILVGNQSWMACGKYWAEDYNHGKDLIKQVFEQ